MERALGTTFEQRVVSELGAGVRVTTAAGQIDATALSVARQAASAVSAEAIEAHAARPGGADD